MSGSEKAHSGLTRRSFLKATGFAAGAAASCGCLAEITACADSRTKIAHTGSESGSEVEYRQCCCTGNCGGNCSMHVQVKDGKAFNITRQFLPNSDMNMVCQRGYSHIHRLYDPTRIKYPMRRVEGTARGAGEWERLSWDDAISYIAESWKAMKAQYGDQSIAFSLGTGNYRADASTYVNRLIAYLGATTIGQCYDMNVAGCMPEAFGFSSVFFGSDPRCMKDAKTIFIWGSNPTEAGVLKMRLLEQAHERGARLVCIDPNYTGAAAKSDHYISIRPGTDGLLAIAMMQLIVENGWQDDDFLAKRTTAPLLVKDDGTYLRESDLGRKEAGARDDFLMVIDAEGNFGIAETVEAPQIKGSFKVDGFSVTTAYSLLLERIYEWSRDDISRLCDIPQEKIEQLAAWYSDGPSTIFTGYGPDHWTNGQTFYHNMSALAMVSGNLAKPGACITGTITIGQMAFGADSSAIDYPADAPYGPTIQSIVLPEVLESGKYEGEDFPIKSIYVQIHNFLANQTDRAKWMKVLDEVELIVVADVYMTETAKHADMVLPVPHYFELESYHSWGSVYMRMNEAISDPQFEAQGDFEIANMLGCAMGMNEKFSISREDYLKATFDNDLAKAMGYDFQKLREEKYIEAFPYEAYSQGEFEDFATPTGRAQFYFENPTPQAGSRQKWDVEKERLPYWEPPFEAWFENELIKTYPLNMLTERAKFKVHTQYGTNPMLLELDPEPVIRINPRDAAQRNLKTGDIARVFNDRGEMQIKVAINSALRPGIVQLDHGWQEEQFISGHYQNLTSRQFHIRRSNNNYFDCLVELEKID